MLMDVGAVTSFLEEKDQFTLIPITIMTVPSPTVAASTEDHSFLFPRNLGSRVLDSAFSSVVVIALLLSTEGTMLTDTVCTNCDCSGNNAMLGSKSNLAFHCFTSR